MIRLATRPLCLARKARTAVGLFTAAATMFSAALAQQNIDVFPLEKVKPGMVGYGLSTFTGTKPERFEFEVLGFMYDRSPNGRFILIRMSGGPLEKTGVIAGMSGSPVYIQDKFAGAVSRGFRYAKDPLAGVTPAEDMLQLLRPSAAKPEATEAKGQVPEGADLRPAVRLCEIIDAREELTRYADNLAAGSPAQYPSLAPGNTLTGPELPLFSLLRNRQARSAELAPIHLPLIVRGISSDAAGRLSPLAEAMGLLPVQAPAGGPAAATEAENLKPGSPVGVAFASGDISMCGTGTLTTRIGNKILTFGHPMMEVGRTDLPLVTAQVQTCVASNYWSFKLSLPGAVVGRFIEDRRPGCLGVIGEKPRQLPCEISLTGFRQLKAKTKLLVDRDFTPMAAAMAVSGAIWSWEGYGPDLVHEVEVKFHLKNATKPVAISDVYCSASPTASVWDTVAGPLMNLYGNPFVEPEIERIEFALNLKEGNILAEMQEISVPKLEYEPGEKCEVDVLIKPHRGETRRLKMAFVVPEDAVPGSTVNVAVCDAKSGLRMEMSASPGAYEAHDYERLLELLQMRFRSTDLVLHAAAPGRGLTYRGVDYPSLPPSVTHVIAAPLRTGVGHSVRHVMVRGGTSWIISGQRRLQIRVASPEQ